MNDKVWKLLKIFGEPYINLTKYRNKLIKKISRKFTVDEFYECEKIIDKMFWDLREKIGKNDSCCKVIEYNGVDDLDNKIYGIIDDIGIYYRSFINKLIIVDKDNKRIYYKKMDSSSYIFNKNEFNLLSLTILFNKELYEGVMNDTININNIELPKYYFELDYCFPNVNCCKYNLGSKDDWINRIKKYYYNDTAEYWFKLII